MVSNLVAELVAYDVGDAPPGVTRMPKANIDVNEKMRALIPQSRQKLSKFLDIGERYTHMHLNVYNHISSPSSSTLDVDIVMVGVSYALNGEPIRCLSNRLTHIHE